MYYLVIYAFFNKTAEFRLKYSSALFEPNAQAGKKWQIKSYYYIDQP